MIAVHWFNPLSYMLFCELTNISEMYCDHVVMEGKNDEERRKYGELILGLAADKNYVEKGKLLTGLAGSRNKKAYRRRILELNANRQGKLILSVLVAGAVSMAGGVTAFAYEEPKVISIYDEHQAGEDVRFIEQSELEPVYDCSFLDSEGNLHVLDKYNSNTRALCFHNYVTGILQDHEKNNYGGCKIYKYNGSMCSYCGSVKYGDLISIESFPVCPH